MNMMSERRKHPRLENNIPVKISSEEFDVVTETFNLSCSGAYCSVKKYLEPMTKLDIHLLVPLRRRNKLITKKISCQGIIVRIESQHAQDGFNAAIYFNDIKDKDRKSLSEYVDATLAKQAPSQ